MQLPLFLHKCREKESMSSPSFQRKIKENAQKFEFQAEVRL
jgi:hypothetical protein